MLCWTTRPNEKCRQQTKFIYSDELFRRQKFMFFVTKTFIVKGVAKNTICDETYFIAKCDK